MFEKIRNIGIIAHIDAGKTSTSERFLYYSGKTHKLGEVDSGNTVLDYLDEERKRGITIVSASASFEWRLSGEGHLIHLIDTPGHIDFTAEVERSLRVIDGAVVIFSGVEGVEAQSEKVWRQSEKYKLPKIAFINKLDRFGASFERTLTQMRKKFPAKKIIPLQSPLGEENTFNSVLDLISGEKIIFNGEDGSKLSREKCDRTDAGFHKWHNEMLSSLADVSDKIAEEFINNGEVGAELLRCEVRRLTISGQVVPVFCGSAKKNIGIQPLLDAVLLYLPNPSERGNFSAFNPKTNEEIKCSVGDSEFRGMIFKIIASASGDLLYMRTYSGKIKVGDSLINPRSGEKVRVKRLLRLYSKNVESIEEAGPGDIIGIIGPSNTFTGDTLCSIHKPLSLDRIIFPEPVISMAIETRISKDKDKLEFALQTICREDPTLFCKKNEATGQLILSGMGELHLEVSAHKLKDEFHVDFRCGEPQVAYRETLTEACDVEGVFDRVIGETRYFASVEISFQPAMRIEDGLETSTAIRNPQNIANSWIKSAEETLLNGLKTGGNWGYSLIYVKAVLKSISGDESTNDSSVAGAVLDAVSKAVKKGTKILEPVVKLEIISPEQYIGDINGFLQSKRAVILGMESMPELKRLLCEVPLSEMFGFSKSLPKLSGGRASFTMEPCGYQEVALEVLEKKAGSR
ncbi:MAG TPA: GTP-binding protein [Victivallales bacterium]|nr:GTP-binding protein [Victivallales bacterium]